MGRQRGFAHLILIILGVSIIVVGYIFFPKSADLNKKTSSILSGTPGFSKCGPLKPIIKSSPTKGWNIFVGKMSNYSCNNSFSIEYPENWRQDGYFLYPFGKTDSDQDPKISLEAGAHDWYPGLEIETEATPEGILRFSWGQPRDKNYIVGFANISKDQDNFVAEVFQVPLDKERYIKDIFDRMLSTFKFLPSMPDEIVNWRMYNDPNNLFSFKYPSDLQLEESINKGKTTFRVTLETAKPDYIEISLNISEKTEEDLVKEIGEQLQKEPFEVGGINANKYTGMSGVAGTVFRERVFFKKNGKTYNFNLGTYDKKKILDQILSTFKFTQ